MPAVGVVCGALVGEISAAAGVMVGEGLSTIDGSGAAVGFTVGASTGADVGRETGASVVGGTAIGISIGASTGADVGRGTGASDVGGGERIEAGVVAGRQETSKTLAPPIAVGPSREIAA